MLFFVQPRVAGSIFFFGSFLLILGHLLPHWEEVRITILTMLTYIKKYTANHDLRN